MPTIHTKRIYEGIVPEDGFCILVDRIWPRGVRKSDLENAIWFKEIAPSTELRKDFKHDPARWEGFKKRYLADLDAQSELVAEFLNLIEDKEIVTLLYSARDTEHNQAGALKEYLERKLS